MFIAKIGGLVESSRATVSKETLAITFAVANTGTIVSNLLNYLCDILIMFYLFLQSLSLHSFFFLAHTHTHTHTYTHTLSLSLTHSLTLPFTFNFRWPPSVGIPHRPLICLHAVCTRSISHYSPHWHVPFGYLSDTFNSCACIRVAGAELWYEGTWLYRRERDRESERLSVCIVVVLK